MRRVIGGTRLAVLSVALFVPLTAGCGDGGGGAHGIPPSAAALTGTYDVGYTLEFDLPARSEEGSAVGVARDVDGELEVTVRLGSYDTVGASGVIQSDGSVALQGFFVYSLNVFFEASGTARVSDTGSERGIAGTLREDAGGATFSFTMRRPSSGTPVAFSGLYRFAFSQSLSGCDCPSTAEMSLDVPVDGIGLTSEGIDQDASNATVGVFAAGECLVSPQGRLGCRTTYAVSDSPGGEPSFRGCDADLGVCLIALSGMLVAEGSAVSGAGDLSFRFGGAFPATSGGEWTAAKIGTP